MNSRLITIVAGTGFLRAYSGTLYLARALQSLGESVSVMVSGTAEEAGEYARMDVPVTCLDVPIGSGLVRKWRTLRLRWRVLSALMRARRAIVTEGAFLPEAALVKRLKGRRFRLANYCQELQLPDEYPQIPRIKIISRLARVPDVVVDVEPGRARVRMEKLGLRQMPLVLRNTIPRDAIPPRGESGMLGRLAGVEIPSGMPVLLHLGGVGREKPLERVIDAVAACREEVFFLAFCNAPQSKVEELTRYASERLSPGGFAVLGPRRRDELLACAWEADIGVVDYSVSVENTSNQRYCAPTKLYEFMALGLAILGSDNEALREIVEKERIGLCAAGGNPESLGKTLERLVANRKELDLMKPRAEEAFRERHCYESLCLPVVEEIKRRFDEPTTQKDADSSSL